MVWNRVFLPSTNEWVVFFYVVTINAKDSDVLIFKTSSGDNGNWRDVANLEVSVTSATLTG